MATSHLPNFLSSPDSTATTASVVSTLYTPLPLNGLLAPPSAPPTRPPPRRPPLPPPAGSGSSFSLVNLTLNIAGCLCSAFEFILCVALDAWILTASVFCLVSGFLNTASTVMLKFSMLPCSFGWKSARCFAKAFVSFLLTTSPSCWSHR